jgi:hypothetical protein
VDCSDGCVAGAGGANDLDTWLLAEEVVQTLPREGFIVDDEDSKRAVWWHRRQPCWTPAMRRSPPV